MSISISHYPSGIGHPYEHSDNQRFPIHPVMGETVWFGAVTTKNVISVRCEIEIDSKQFSIQAHRRRCDSVHEIPTSATGHLAVAQASALTTEGDQWSATIKLFNGENCRYRFIAEGNDRQRVETEWFSFKISRWVNTPGNLRIIRHGKGEFPRISNVQSLTDGEHTYRLRLVLPLKDNEHVVGFGERYDAVDQRGLTPDSVVFEQYKGQGRTHRTYFPMPFAHVVGGDGWGFYIRTSRRVWFDIGVLEKNKLQIQLETVSDEITELDLFQGSPTEVLSSFLDLTGRATELPSWVFRLWASGNEWNTQNAIMNQVELHRQYDIPIGTIVIEAWSDEEEITTFRDALYRIDYSGNPRKGKEFTYPKNGAWPNPKIMIRQLHEQGIKVVLWQIPLLKSADTFAHEHQKHGKQVIIDGKRLIADKVAVREEDGSPYHNRGWWFPRALMPDLSTEQGRKWWSDRRKYLVEDLDIDGFKTDGGEHAWGDKLRYNDGTRGDNGNNLNPVRYVRTYCELLKDSGKAPITFSRAGFVGSQKYGIFWAGDEDSTWEAFRSSIRAGITIASCGVIYWGWDLAGFSGPIPSSELYLRAATAAAFMPIMQYHSEFNHQRRPIRDRTPWNIAEQNGDETVIRDFRKVVKQRERIIPYLVQQTHRAIKHDTPLMRSLFFDYPKDKYIWEKPLEYMLGDSLLINPVTERDSVKWETYLPDGNWVNVWTGEVLSGNQKIISPVLERTNIPVFCKKDDWGTLKLVFSIA